ncbi:uncharacterized protein MELLADRAFT_103434 [Melampsora larici-populina 98AG31]|uniref:CBS domain-containing protein n=1 Tax=Melampsora larici-populina (strain 98AG31 / pathotype 3-4-7) TaxID=747676 RepID=F4RBG0_MELLP|nr:uncharacterized protein MELLADRAFT_103434 [Melampsora larici-populina 98AG31]EGG10367.1 hypothetical protein MELLADRAFT_103434 [Melampsora larici-populina 98AG31]
MLLDVVTTGHDRKFRNNHCKGLGMLAGVHVSSTYLSHVQKLAGRTLSRYSLSLRSGSSQRANTGCLFKRDTYHLSHLTSVASMREFDILPVIDSQTRSSSTTAHDQVSPSKGLSKCASDSTSPLEHDAHGAVSQFISFPENTAISPGTPLEELAKFFKSERFAIVTDTERRFVLAIVVREDLEK